MIPGNGQAERIPEAQRARLKCSCGCPLFEVRVCTTFVFDRLDPHRYEMRKPEPAYRCVDCGRLAVQDARGWKFIEGKEIRDL